MIDLPSQFVAKIVAVHGKAGQEWLAGLGGLIGYCKDKWHIELLPAHEHLSFNFVAPVFFHDGSKAVLKLGLPGKGIDSEIAALQAFQGQGFCRLLAAEPQKGIALLECIEPGEPLDAIQDDGLKTSAASQLIGDLLRVSPETNYPFTRADDWYDELLSLQKRFGNTDIPDYLFHRAIQNYLSLRTDPQPCRLLHGDLHQGNILSAGNNSWKAIDPKGIVGETGCELIPFLMNDLKEEIIADTLWQRTAAFSSTLAIEPARIARWGSFRSVLALYWNLEDNLPITSKDLLICESFYRMSIGS